MAYNPEIAERIREALTHRPDVVERTMFGGLAFLIRGNMTVVASSKGGLMIRADPTTTAHLVETTPAEFAEMRGRQMRGWLLIDGEHLQFENELDPWINQALDYCSSLPSKD